MKKCVYCYQLILVVEIYQKTVDLPKLTVHESELPTQIFHNTLVLANNFCFIKSIQLTTMKTNWTSPSTWMKLAAAVTSMRFDLVNGFMTPPTTMLTPLKNRLDMSMQSTDTPTTQPSNEPHKPFRSIQLTGGPKLNEEGYTGEGIKVAVIDSGIDCTHSGFKKGKVKFGASYVGERKGLVKMHGTHVAGIIQ